MFKRTLVAIGVALTMAAMSTSPPVLAQPTGEDYEDVLFRVTLEGPVDPAHTFAVRFICQEQRCATEDITVVCSPPSMYNYPRCAAATYEFTARIAAGLTVDYALLRWTSPDLSHTGDQPEEHLRGSWVVQEGRQVISLGYVYPGAGNTTSSPTVPDTAMTAPRR